MAYLQDVYAANLNAVCHVGGRLQIPSGAEWAYREHAFTQNKFYFITGGRCRITVDGKDYEAEAGSWFFIPAGTRHKYTGHAGVPLEKYWIHFDLYPNAGLAQQLRLPAVVNVQPNDEAYILFEKLTEANRSGRLTEKLNAKGYLLQLLARYVALAGEGEATVSDEEEERLQQLLAYIHEHLDETLANEELAKRCHLHPTHFIRYFRGRTGQTPQDYVAERRMEAAKRLLEETQLPVSQIMAEVGVQESGYFARLFRKRYGVTPTEHRKRAWAEDGKTPRNR